MCPLEPEQEPNRHKEKDRRTNVEPNRVNGDRVSERSSEHECAQDGSAEGYEHEYLHLFCTTSKSSYALPRARSEVRCRVKVSVVISTRCGQGVDPRRLFLLSGLSRWSIPAAVMVVLHEIFAGRE